MTPQGERRGDRDRGRDDDDKIVRTLLRVIEHDEDVIEDLTKALAKATCCCACGHEDCKDHDRDRDRGDRDKHDRRHDEGDR